MTPKLIDTLTNIVAFLLFMLEPIRAYFSTGEPFNIWTFLTCILGAVVAYLTGKSAKALLPNRAAPIESDAVRRP